jgi:hypothetical protein|tara:strand:- start:16 stop:1347 length:1332 start_codon:yes stop_codon:yes gene_type:complete
MNHYNKVRVIKMLPPLPTKTSQETTNKDIQDFLNLLDDGRIIVNDKYQRGEIGQYKPAFRTRLVESIIRGFPLPPLLVMEMSDGPDELIDGQQRIRTIESFMSGNFAMDGKHLLMLDADAYDEVKWNDLDGDHKDRIRRRFQLTVNYIDDSMPPHKVYHLINGGQNPLNKAELRKAHFGGDEKYWAIDDYAHQTLWTENLTNAYIKREKGTESVFKGLMSMLYGDKLVSGSQNTWLEHHIQQFFDTNSLEDIDKSLKDFTKVVSTARQVFGDAPFGNPEKLSSKVKNPIIMMMPYMIHQGIKKYNRKSLESNATMVREVFAEFCKETVGAAHTYSVSGSDVTERNKNLWATLDAKLSTVAKATTRGTKDRITPKLSQEVIEHYRETDGKVKCQICDEVIMDETQISIDHKVAWINDGETVLENLQPTHGPCNSSKHAEQILSA